jgi:aminoglycoside phosphotransferase (APT) family kinase protein
VATADELAARVRGAFPALDFSHAELNERGEDHQVVVLDGRHLFRFPRHPGHPTGLALELAVLRALRRRCAIPTPDYRHVASGGDFAGYEMIAGVELTPRRFAALARDARERVLDQIAEFLSAMHALTLDEVIAELGAPPEAWPREETPAGLVADGRIRRLPPIARAYPELAVLVEAFYARFETMAPGPDRLLHGDVTNDHLLLAPSGDCLAGVIDFGDVEIGDVAYDFAYLWSYGEQAPAHVFARYGLKDQDPGVPERSRWHFARYRIARLGEAVERGWTGIAEDIAAGLPATLTEIIAMIIS